ncbi:DUF72 domain-containing protein [Flaviaesturariibacter flavus]|uniref:DUF72 domain-containing protein n=1 Tax=Flaviaesturariibacter flavus TaxID=2502780 RepID=A0A4V2NV49_9BACT|nr:DUF72 domain-containing protein [Flaviaesturariibacter flavus]TCJ12086.1 DUF72 domain-containing protein [Flaviaesturariibacter flavus]
MQQARATAFYSGTSNILVPLKQSEFPTSFEGASRLTYYASLFTSLEVNSSFYKLPRPATVAKWRDSVPEGFRFTFKVPKSVTHAKGLQFISEDVARFAEAVAEAGDKKGCLLVQLPPSLKRDHEEELEGLLETLAGDTAGWHIAVEFRHVSWYHREVYRMLQRHGAGMVEQDMPASATPPANVSERFAYLRFHGPGGRYRGSYDHEVLEAYAARIAGWLGAGKDVYAYFNNTMGDALANLQTLNGLVERSPGKK